jgi:hypothetical protein
MIIPIVHISEMIIPIVHISGMIMPIVHISGMIIPIVHISGMIIPLVYISGRFRKRYSTPDNIFFLHVLIDVYIYVVWEKLYCTFIDFKKALDTVWRLGLWQKLVKNID